MKTIHSTSMAALLAGFALMAASIRPVSAYCVLDGSFNPGGSFSSGGTSVLAITTQSDGKVIVGGYFTYYGNYPNGYPFTANNLVRFNVNGTVDTSYNPSPNNIVRAILMLPDNKIIIGGHFTQVSGLTQTYISRLTTNGYPDYIGFQAPVPNNYVYALGRKSDGLIIVGGAFTTMAGFTYSRVACLKTTGGLVATFNPGVYGGSSAAVYSIAVYPAGTPSADKIIIGGDFTSVGGYSRVNIARLNSTGPTDTAFDTGAGNTLNGPVYSVATDYGPFSINGMDYLEKVLIGGAFTSPRNYFARLANEGYPDFNVISAYVDGTVKSIRVQSDHKILLGGSFVHSQSYTKNGVSRLVPNLDLIGWDVDWADCTPSGAGGGTVEALGLSSAGSIYVGGNFTTFEGNARPKVARLFSAP